MLCHAVPCCAKLSRAEPCCAMLCQAEPCRAERCCAMPCQAEPCRAGPGREARELCPSMCEPIPSTPPVVPQDVTDSPVTCDLQLFLGCVGAGTPGRGGCLETFGEKGGCQKGAREASTP
ncbi:hypothetical protein TURU_159414 [Turdus rufiventris]|nr:hypothetical protein TURU_159414 [Turdus rufiventris]